MAANQARVVFTAGFSRRYTGGVREFEIEAKNLRGVIREMDRLYPGLGHHLEEETTVAIDGQIHETAYFRMTTELDTNETVKKSALLMLRQRPLSAGVEQGCALTGRLRSHCERTVP